MYFLVLTAVLLNVADLGRAASKDEQKCMKMHIGCANQLEARENFKKVMSEMKLKQSIDECEDYEKNCPLAVRKTLGKTPLSTATKCPKLKAEIEKINKEIEGIKKDAKSGKEKGDSVMKKMKAAFSKKSKSMESIDEANRTKKCP